MFDRWYASFLKERLERPFVHLLFGARQSGKSTLLHALLPPGWFLPARPYRRIPARSSSRQSLIESLDVCPIPAEAIHYQRQTCTFDPAEDRPQRTQTFHCNGHTTRSGPIHRQWPGLFPHPERFHTCCTVGRT